MCRSLTRWAAKLLPILSLGAANFCGANNLYEATFGVGCRGGDLLACMKQEPVAFPLKPPPHSAPAKFLRQEQHTQAIPLAVE